MNWLDIVIICITALLIINGVRKGFILSLATLIALVLGIWAAIHYSGYISHFLNTTFHPSGTWLSFLSYTLTFLVVVIVVILIGKLLERVIKTIGLGIPNRIIGGLFGLVKGILGVSVLLFIIYTFDPKEKMIRKKTKETSFCYPFISQIFPLYSKVLKK